MDPLFDDFFTAENQNNQKFGTLFDPDFLSSPFSEHSDSTGIFPNFLPKTIKNFLDVDEGTPSDLMKRENDSCARKNKPFQIIKQKKEPSPEHSEFNEAAESVYSGNDREIVENRVGVRSKRITKPEKPKEKIKFKQDAESIMRRVDKKYIPEGFDDPELDDQSKKKMVQMIRNRVSAQSSRDKKKMYMQQLEDAKDELAFENELLSKDKVVLQERIRKLEYEQTVLIQENENLKKNTSYLCSKCGCTLEYEEPMGGKNMEFTESALPSPVGLSRGQSRSKNFFGFSLGFAVILCVLFVLNGGLVPTPYRPTSARYFAQNGKYEEFQGTNVPNQISNDPFDSSITGNEDQYGVFYIIRSLFSQIAETCLQPFETQNTGIVTVQELQPSANQVVEQISSIDSVIVQDTSDKYIDEISPLVFQNKSAASCPNDSEFFDKINMGIIEEKQINSFDTQYKLFNQPIRVTSDIEPAGLVRVVLNKKSINRLSSLENIYEIEKMRIYQELEIPKEEEGNPWIEVWCKIFAVRDVASF